MIVGGRKRGGSKRNKTLKQGHKFHPRTFRSAYSTGWKVCARVRGVKTITNQTYKELILCWGQGARSGWEAVLRTEKACNLRQLWGLCWRRVRGVEGEPRGAVLERWNNGGSYQWEKERDWERESTLREEKREREAGVVVYGAKEMTSRLAWGTTRSGSLWGTHSLDTIFIC